jgi:isoquinoline 1-oxidoreductase alpha subunit
MISLEVNGVVHQVNVANPDMPLLWVLRDVIGLTGTKYGCGIEVCGACTVLVDGEAQRSCQINASSVVGSKITTVEGLSPDGKSHPLQKAWIELQVPQCGYCQSGMLMAACSALNGNDDGITNVCVCGTYQRIGAAIQLAKTL